MPGARANLTLGTVRIGIRVPTGGPLSRSLLLPLLLLPSTAFADLTVFSFHCAPCMNNGTRL